jgi:hypothetical protein
MDFALSEELTAIKATAEDFAARAMAPFAAAWDEGAVFPVETLRKAGELGFGGLYVGEDVGGTGLGRIEAAVVFEALARACPSTTAFISIHNMATWMIDRYGDAELRRRLVPPLAALAGTASYCLTEPGSGSDAASLRTRAVRDGDHYVVTGSKAFISGASASDVYVTMVRTGGAGPDGITCLAIEKGTPGLSFGAQEKKLGWKSQPTAMVNLDQCRVPVANRVGAEGEGFRIAMAGLDGGRINIAACSVGAAAECLDRAIAYMKERSQFGRKLTEFQALQFRLADMATELEAARLMVWKAATMLDARAPGATRQCAMAKRFATDVGFEVVNQALQLHGGYGYLADYGIERYLRDLRVHQILEGTNEIMRVIIARDLIGR